MYQIQIQISDPAGYSKIRQDPDPAVSCRSISIKDIEITVILNARKCFLFSTNGVWVKRLNDPSKAFDIPIGSPFGGDVTDLKGLYMLYLLRTVLRDRVILLGICRNDIPFVT